ncbi:hypothetical protein [Cupriavidus cauae]|uniref:Uncharacterized protein n=1 Tax=Cupriavidus cauae TaxID=2608999 RepID=A0A5M8B5N3_9BURK|nr:hypothetical protein [Cupriavidus cauae]KAA6131158.1 hypothetical protein F1599_02470 [Cupriavidus cauae]
MLGVRRGVIAAHRGTARHGRRETNDERIDGDDSRRDVAARIAYRHRLARRRAACASIDRVMRRRNALPFASAMSMPTDARSTFDRRSIDDRRGRSTTRSTASSTAFNDPRR